MDVKIMVMIFCMSFLKVVLSLSVILILVSLELMMYVAYYVTAMTSPFCGFSTQVWASLVVFMVIEGVLGLCVLLVSFLSEKESAGLTVF